METMEATLVRTLEATRATRATVETLEAMEAWEVLLPLLEATEAWEVPLLPLAAMLVPTLAPTLAAMEARAAVWPMVPTTTVLHPPLSLLFTPVLLPLSTVPVWASSVLLLVLLCFCKFCLLEHDLE
jgi:hypothetical protein